MDAPKLKTYLIVFLSGVVVSSLVWVFIVKKPSTTNPEVGLVKKAATEVVDALKMETLTVDVSGAVNSPGVYKLPDGSRISDALQAASGVASDSASKKYLSQNLNLAQLIIDGQKIYIPFEGDDPPSQGFGGAGGAGVTLGGVISINNASSSELDTLPGIGPATAAKIIAGRPYRSIDELLSKKAVGQSVFDGIKDRVRL